MYCPWQELVPGKTLTPIDLQGMDEEYIKWAQRHKLERIAAWQQIKGYSNTLKRMAIYSSPPLTINSFKLPAGFNLRPVSWNEGRKTIRSSTGEQDISYIVDTGTKVRIAILPDAPITVRLLTVQLDQGKIGTAGAAFLMFHMHLMVMAVFDKIHRLIRDIKNAENQCCRKIFTKTKLWSAYLFSLNKRPFGSGGNATLKSRWMHIFSTTETITSTTFVKHLPQIAKDWGMPHSTETEKQAIFEKVVQLASFRLHLSHPKLANWFSWNMCAKQQLPEFYATKMIFESQLRMEEDNLVDPDESSFEIGANGASADPRKELSAMFKDGGGMKLAYRLMKQALYEHSCIMFVAERPCWDFYTREVTNIKSPADALKRTWELSSTWAKEPHLWATLEQTLFNPQNLNYMHIDIGPSENATKALHLAWTLASMRMWTMAKQSSPPCCYAQILQPGPEHADSRHTCVEEMKTHHRNILVLETSRHNNEDSRTLWSHCHFLNMMPVRLLLEYFKRDQWRETSPDGIHLLTGLVGLLCEGLWKPPSSF